jgi:hypothetical protein
MLLGYAGWRGAEYLVEEGRPARLLERAVAIAPSTPASTLTAVFLFRPDECPSLMGVVELLHALETREIRVVGALMVEEYRMPEWKLLVEAAQIRFPVYQLDPAKARAAISSLGYAGGAMLVVFDGDGRIVLATDALERPDFKDYLESIARRLSARQDRARIRA